MSQIFQSQTNRNSFSLQLVKFSHSLSLLGANFTWIHSGPRDDLVMTIEDYTDAYGGSTRTILRVSAGNEIWEEQDLGEVSQAAGLHTPASGVEALVHIVVKFPAIAMRYPKGLDRIRRIQIKFNNEADFARVVDALRQFNLPLTDATGVPISLAHPSASTSLPALKTGRPLLPSPASTHRPSSTSSQNNEFKIPARPNTVSSGFQPSINNGMSVFSSSPMIRPRSASSFSTALSTPNSIEYGSIGSSSSLYQSNMQFNPGPRQTSSIYLSQLQKEENQLQPMSENQYLPDSNLPSSTPRQYPTLSIAQGPDRTLATSPFFSPQNEPEHLPRPATANQFLPQKFSLDNDSCLPPSSVERSASTPLERSDILIPPRRELPFPKPRDPSVPPHSAKASAPKKDSRVAPASTPTRKPVRRVAQRKGSMNPELANKQAREPPPALSGEAILNRGLQNDGSPLAARSSATAFPRSSPASGLPSKITSNKRPAASTPLPQGPATKRLKMVDQGMQCNIITLKVPEKNAAPIPAAQPPAPAQPDRPTSPPEEFLNSLDAFVAKHGPRPAPNGLEVWERPGWADGDEGTRQKILRDFILECLDDPHFIQLCKDMEVAWERYGFGK